MSPAVRPPARAGAGANGTRKLRDEDYRRLLAFRTELHDFLRWSEEAAHEAGLTPSLHQLLLVVRGHRSPEGPTIGEVAEKLHVKHHSVVELAQRAENASLVCRVRDERDHRRIRLQLTNGGYAHLDALTRAHLPRIAALARALGSVALLDP
jgi:DNA-binding MarR family transcriptional regulator